MEDEEIQVKQEIRVKELGEELDDKLEEAFHHHIYEVILHEVVKIALDHDPIDLAHAVTKLPGSSRIVVYENLPDLAAKTIFMIHASRSTRSAVFRKLSDEEIVELLAHVPPDESVWMLDDMSDRRSKRILESIDSLLASRIRDLQRHDRQSAGRMMTDEYFAFPLMTTVETVSQAIRNRPGIEFIRAVFVTSQEGELIGWVPDRTLIVSRKDILLKQVMRPVLHTVFAETSRDEVVDLVERYDLPTLPVVDQEGRLIGVITYEDVVETMEDIADETIASIAGTGEDLAEHESILRRCLWRAPWLLVTLLAGLCSASIMSHFMGEPWFLFVPFFVPLITGMSGNVGIQCSTILVRGMSTGEVSRNVSGELVTNELLIGLVIGSTFGVFCGSFVFLLREVGYLQSGSTPFVTGITVACGVLAASLNATTLGTFSPFLFASLGVDPAVASGPIVTAMNDVLSMLLFFLVAWVVWTLTT